MKMKAKQFSGLMLCLCIALTLLPVTTRAAGPADLLLKLPESKPGNFAVKWYSCKRYRPGFEPGHGATPGLVFDTMISGPVNKEASDAALGRYDASIVLGQQGMMRDLTFDMTRWQQDKEYYDRRHTLDNTSLYNWNWCEVEGFIRVPRVYNAWESLGCYYLYSIDVAPLERNDVSCKLEIPGIRFITEEREIVPFRLRVKCYEPDPDQIKPNTRFSIAFTCTSQLTLPCQGTISVTPELAYDSKPKTVVIPPQNIYSSLELKDMAPFFSLDPTNCTLNLDMNACAFNVNDYEYGYADGTDFSPLASGANFLDPRGGEVIVRYKNLIPHPFITIGVMKPDGSTLVVAERTPATATLKWSAPEAGTPVTYNIYRQKVDELKGKFNPSAMSLISASNTAVKAGSTSALTFTDQELRYDEVYSYYITATFADGHIIGSKTVRTDSVEMKGLPSIPGNLKADLDGPSRRAYLKLSWDASVSPVGIKEYIIYRKVTPDPNTAGINLMNYWCEQARTAELSYLDHGMSFTDTCEYYVQAVDKNGAPSYLGSPLAVSLQGLVAPNLIAPDTMEVYNGETFYLDASYNDAYPGDRSGTWSAADSSIVSVEDDSIAPVEINTRHVLPAVIRGKATGKKPGTTTVTFINTVTGVRDSCRVTVKPAFTIAPKALTVHESETGSFNVAFDDRYTGSRNGIWHIDDFSVASIDQNGIVTGKKAGTAIATYVLDTAAGEIAASSASLRKEIVRTVPVVVKPANYTVSFDAQGGSPEPGSVTVKHDTTVARPDDPSKGNAEFLGWYTDTFRFRARLWDFENDKVTADITLYADWYVPSASHRDLHILPGITGPDNINLTVGYPNTDQAYTVSGNPAPALTITANTAGATLSGDTLTIPAGLEAGSYAVTLTAASSVGSTDMTITVNVLPAAQDAPTISGPDTIFLSPAYTDGSCASYAVTGNPTSYDITADPSYLQAFSFNGTDLVVASGVLTADNSPYVLTLTATNTVGTGTKDVTVYVISLEPAVLDVNEDETVNEMLSVLGAGVIGTYTLQLGPNPPDWVSLSDNTLTVEPPAETVTSGSSETFDVDIIIMVEGGNSTTKMMNITVRKP